MIEGKLATIGPAKIPRGERRRLRTRSAILTAGQHLFANRPIEGVTIDDIVAEADVAKGSFYNHFEDKQGLADAILQLVHGDCEFHILAANRGIDDPAVRMVRALCVMIAYAAGHPDRVQALLSLTAARRTVAGSPLNAGVVGDLEDGLIKGRFAGLTLETGLLAAIGLIGITIAHVTAKASRASATDLATGVGASLLRALGVGSAEAGVLAQSRRNRSVARNMKQ